MTHYYLPVLAKAIAITVLLGPLSADEPVKPKRITETANDAAEVSGINIFKSRRKQVTIANWDKGGSISRWVYTHVSEVFPSAIVRCGGAIVDLPLRLRPEIGRLVVSNPEQATQTLDQFVANGAVDGCIVLHGGAIVYEKYPSIEPNDLHILMSVTKAVLLTVLAILEDQNKVDLANPVETYLPELKGSDWEGKLLRDLVDMRSGMEGSEDSNDAYRNPKHKQFQLEATLGWQCGLRLRCQNPLERAIFLDSSVRSNENVRLAKSGLTPAATPPS